ncbi:tetratricopeptide repeat protein [Sedimenticola selenatireducens]|uniref:Tetratricopeptide repeat protein n=1 Tax=Sedimenticola selenatireducens TaxID=191960 RepID=A0A558DSI0_9GAMM|nr:tetratricopeptide repeat protein [Sedimenticola selenatireducens]TVO76568.1 tetratricopeptide repeat protein [Sedimenticola selenatireducens]TVT64012.1 MAG: tetratricopeptide repeat protein [Sedimenticola selenatireducens]
MRQLLQRVLLFSLIGFLVSCQSSGVKKPLESQSQTVTPGSSNNSDHSQASFRQATVPELTSDIIFNLLAGEVAAQRGALKDAYEYQFQAALLSGDTQSAERATRLALHVEDDDRALKAAHLWVKLAPEDMTARQLVVVLMLRKNQDAMVFDHLKAIVQISEDNDENGFLNVMAAVNRELKRESAVDLMRRLVAEFPGDPRGRYALAIAALVDKKYADAEAEASGLVSEHPEWPRGYLVLSRVYIAEEKRDKARETLADAVRKFPSDPHLVSAYARLLVEYKELPLAYEQFLLLEEIEKEMGGAGYWLGLIALELGKDDEARKHFLQLISIGKQVDTAAYYLGRIEENKAQPESAIKWYQRVTSGEFSDEAEARIVRLMVAEGDISQAQDWLQRMRIQNPADAARYYLIEAELLREHGTVEQVMMLFDTALGAMPESNELLYARGLYAASQNRVDILEQDMLKVIASDPKHADALNALGYTLADQTDRFKEALEYIQRALVLKPDSAPIMDSMGWVLYRMGRHEEAIKYLQQAFAKLPDAEIAAHLGEVLWVSGDRLQAEKVWQDVLEKTPDSKHVLEVMQRLKM